MDILQLMLAALGLGVLVVIFLLPIIAMLVIFMKWTDRP